LEISDKNTTIRGKNIKKYIQHTYLKITYMALIVKKGAINHLSETTVNIGRNGNVNSQHAWAFRIDSTPAKLKSATHSSLADGDQVTAVGAFKKGTLAVYAIRNDTTGAYDQLAVVPKLILGILFILVGIPLSFFLVGLVPLFFGVLTLYEVYLGYNAKAILARS
jgi:hypothetical protein